MYDESNITASDDLMDACKAVILAMEDKRARTRVEVWELAPVLHPGQVFSLHIGQFISIMFCDPSLFEMWRKIPVSQWSSV